MKCVFVFCMIACSLRDEPNYELINKLMISNYAVLYPLSCLCHFHCVLYVKLVLP